MKKILPALKFVLIAGTLFHLSCAKGMNTLELKRGPLADYGASPWYTEDIKIGTNKLKLSPDSGANFIWATSDLCNTSACDAHEKVDTSQPGFVWISKKDTTHSFGPWGSMITRTGNLPFHSDRNGTSTDLNFFASVNYSGEKFKTLAWDGGIGFPSVSSGVETGSGFYFGALYSQNQISRPSFSFVTHPDQQSGMLYLGGDDPAQYVANSDIVLNANTSGIVSYLWGTDLYSVAFGTDTISSLNNAIFYLDSGSSQFKGDSVYLTPILQLLYDITDAGGNRIFEKVYSGGQWVSLVYADGKSPDDYPGLLPDMILAMGQTCGNREGMTAKITLSPDQYSYKIETGERAGRWAPAFAVLDGVGGLLVGSTFLDLFYTKFNYVDDGNGNLSQGNMILRLKQSDDGPKNVSCNFMIESTVFEGTWYNSYCSQVTLNTDPSGKITGIYTSHTGSTGSSNVIGWMGRTSESDDNSIYGTPVALGIQWRLINQPQSEADGSWNWVSTFSGQYHPAQTVRVEGQKPYSIDETLEILNGLVVTATAPPLVESQDIPVMWPQTLEFHHTQPSYCESVTPPEPVEYTPTATDRISGKWKTLSGKETLELSANMQTGSIQGSYTSGGKTYSVIGLADTLESANDSDHIQQGVTIVMKSEDGDVISMAGGVYLDLPKTMDLWSDRLDFTTWTYRFMNSNLNQTKWIKAF